MKLAAELTPLRFLLLTIASHLSLLYILATGSLFEIASVFVVSFLIILLSSVPVYHRYISHRSWNCPRWYEIFASFLGVFSFTGSTIIRTVTHRQHHAYTDTPKDPHSPFFLKWYEIYFPYFKNIKLNIGLARDIASDPLHKFIHRFYLLIILFVIIAVSLLLSLKWAIVLAVAPGALCWLNVCVLNIFGHSQQGGSNNRILSFFTLGEGNHKYHHKDPAQSNTGGTDFDLSYRVIRLIEHNRDELI